MRGHVHIEATNAIVAFFEFDRHSRGWCMGTVYVAPVECDGAGHVGSVELRPEEVSAEGFGRVVEDAIELSPCHTVAIDFDIEGSD